MTKPLKLPTKKDIQKAYEKRDLRALCPTIEPPSPTPYEILVLDDFIHSLILPKPIYEYNDKQLAKLFRIHITFISEEDMPQNIYSITKPVNNNHYNAEIKIREKDGKFNNALMKEIAYYLLNLNNDGKLKKTYVRPIHEKKTKETVLRDTMLGLITISENTARSILTERNKNPESNIRKIEQTVLKTKRISVEVLNRRLSDLQRIYASGTLFEIKHTAARTKFLPVACRINNRFYNHITSKQPR